MINFLIIFICLFSGFLIKRFANLPNDSHKIINIWVLYIALPAVSFKYVPYINWDKDMLLPVLTPLIVWSGSYIFVKYFCYLKKINNIDRATLFLTCGLSNTSFLGFPLVSAYFGENSLNIAVVIDQINFLIFSSLGLIVTLKSKGNPLNLSEVFKKVIKFPPFIGFISAVFLASLIDLSPLDQLFNQLAATVSPLALFSIGLQLNIKNWKPEFKNLSAGLFYKLLIAPTLVYLIALIFQIKGNIANVSILEAAMPSLVSSFIMIDQYGLNAKLANLMIGLGIIISFATSFLWYLVLSS